MNQNSYWTKVLDHRVSRRTMLRGAGITGIGLAGAALIGCGDDDDDDDDDGGGGGGGGGGTTPSASQPDSGVKRGGTLRVSNSGDPPTLDTYANNSFLTKRVAAFAYNRLFKLGTGEDILSGSALPVPDIAEGAETDDGQTWVVKLKPGVKFHDVAPVDGRELTSEDVAASWGKMIAEEHVQRDAVSFVEQFDVIDERTVKFTLKAPSAVFLVTMADANLFWILPKEAGESGGFDPALKVIGAGPWMLDEYQTSVKLVYKRHPEYHLDGFPIMDGVTELLIPEYANALAQLQAGSLDILNLRADDVLPIRDQLPDLQLLGNNGVGLSMFYFNDLEDSSNPWFDERVRFAVSMAINRDEIHEFAYNVKALREAGLEASDKWNNYPIPVGHSAWWLDPKSPEQGDSAKYFQYNPDEAAKMLAAVVGPDGLEVPYLFNTNRYGSLFSSIAEANIRFLEEVGFKLDVTVQDYASEWNEFTGRGFFFGLAFGPQTPHADPGGFRRGYNKDEEGKPVQKNRIKLIDEDMLVLWDKQAGAFDPEERKEILFEIQRYNDERMYYVPNQSGAGTTYTAFAENLRDLRFTRSYGSPLEVYASMWMDT